MSVYIISLVILCVILVGAFRKVDCYQSFIDGAKEGIDTSLNMFVYLLVFTVAISTINNSQIIEFLSCFFNGKYLLICLQCLVRPLSSSGSLSLMINNYHYFGVDNKISLLSTLINYISDSTLYIVPFYLGVNGIKNNNKIILLGLLVNLFSYIIVTFVALLFF